MLEHHSHTSVSLLAPAICWLVFLSWAIFDIPGRAIGLPIAALMMAFFLILPFPMFKDWISRLLDITPSWRAFRYLRITRSDNQSFRRPQDWRFIGIARKSE